MFDDAEVGAAEGIKYLQQKLKTFLESNTGLSKEDMDNSTVITGCTYRAMNDCRPQKFLHV